VSSASRARFAEVVRSEPVDVGLACLLVGGEVDPDLDVETGLAALDELAATVELPPGLPATPAVAAEALRRALVVRAGFAGGSFEQLRSSLLSEVLRRGEGLPLLLSVVWVEVALRRGIPAYAVGLPGRVVVCIGDAEDEHVVVDPYDGGRRVTRPQLSALVGRPAVSGDLVPLRPEDLLLRLLTNVRALTTRQPRSLPTAATRLWAVELSLLLPRHPADLRRERGELLVQLGNHVAGAEELETYAAVVEDADERGAASARGSARSARAQLN
jgi:regulator of sirC expression with transglutaminase-like and TPR domain